MQILEPALNAKQIYNQLFSLSLKQLTAQKVKQIVEKGLGVSYQNQIIEDSGDNPDIEETNRQNQQYLLKSIGLPSAYHAQESPSVFVPSPSLLSGYQEIFHKAVHTGNQQSHQMTNGGGHYQPQQVKLSKLYGNVQRSQINAEAGQWTTVNYNAGGGGPENKSKADYALQQEVYQSQREPQQSHHINGLEVDQLSKGIQQQTGMKVYYDQPLPNLSAEDIQKLHSQPIQSSRMDSRKYENYPSANTWAIHPNGYNHTINPFTHASVPLHPFSPAPSIIPSPHLPGYMFQQATGNANIQPPVLVERMEENLWDRLRKGQTEGVLDGMGLQRELKGWEGPKRGAEDSKKAPIEARISQQANRQNSKQSYQRRRQSPQNPFKSSQKQLLAQPLQQQSVIATGLSQLQASNLAGVQAKATQKIEDWKQRRRRIENALK